MKKDGMTLAEIHVILAIRYGLRDYFVDKLKINISRIFECAANITNDVIADL
jgi:hypothetical protein